MPSLLRPSLKGVALKKSGVSITLNSLSLTSSNFYDNAITGTFIGTINGKTNSSTISITPSDSRVALSGNSVVVGSGTLTTGTFNITLRETLVGATNSPRDTVISMTISAYIALNALTLSASSFTANATAGTAIGAIQNKTSGSTLSIFPEDTRVALSGNNLIVGLTPSNAGTFNVTIRETLAGAANSPRDTVLSITANAIVSISPPPFPTSYVATNGALNANATTTLNVNIPAASNRILLVSAAMPAGINGGTITGVSLDGQPLTLLDTRDLTDTSRRNYQTIWYKLAPKVGSGVVTVTRTPASGQESTTVRVLSSAFTIIDAAQTAPTVLGALSQASDLGTYSLTTSSTVDDTSIINFISADLFSGSVTTPTMTLQSGDSQIGSAQAVGATAYISAVQGRFETPSSDTATLTLSGTTPQARNGIIVSVGIVGVANEAYVPIYYVSNEGSDSNDGQTEANSVKTLTPLLGITGGGEIRLKAGQRHRPESFASARTLVDFQSSGTSLSPLKIRSFGTGARPILDGSVIVSGWSAVSSGEVFSNANSASIEKMTTPPTLHRNQFPVAGAGMLWPAQWPVPSANDAIDSSGTGFDAFNRYDSSTFASRVSSVGSSAPYTITITDPAIAVRYGANSPKGYVVAFRAVPNVTSEAIITAYNQGSSSITFTSNLPAQAPQTNAPFYFAIRFHPLDITRAGQYAWLLNGSDVITNLAGWFPSGERAVTYCSSIITSDVDYINIDGVDMSRVAANPADAPNARASFIMQPQSGGVADYLTVKNSKMTQAYDPDRTGAIAVHGGSTSDNWVIEDIEFDDIITQSGIRGNGLQGATIQRINVKRNGRTGIYLAQVNNTVRDVDVSDNISVHGNGITTYVQARNCLIENVTSLGNTNPATSQVDTYTSGDIKANIWRSLVATGMRRPDGGTETAWGIRFDGGDTNTLMEMIVSYGCNSGGMVLSGTAGSNSGMTIRRAALQSLGTTSNGLNGITLDRVLLCGTHAGLTTLADYTAAGATVINCEIDTNQTWNGCLTLKQQRYLTWASGSPGSEVYESFVLGDSRYNWVVPAYGTIGAMVDLGLTRTSVYAGHQAGKTIGCVVRPRPGSTLSLPSAGDNALFGIDRGNVYPLSNLTTGNKTLVLRENNVDATNGPSRDTIIIITVY